MRISLSRWCVAGSGLLSHLLLACTALASGKYFWRQRTLEFQRETSQKLRAVGAETRDANARRSGDCEPRIACQSVLRRDFNETPGARGAYLTRKAGGSCAYRYFQASFTAR